MNFERRTIVLTTLAFIGTVFAIQFFSQRPEPLHGYAVFGELGADQNAAMSLVSWHSDDTASNQPKATTRGTRAYLIALGRDIYLDVNQNGQPESSERFKKEVNSFEIKSHDGRSVYRLTRAALGLHPDYIPDNVTQHVVLNVDVLDIDQPESVKFRQSGKINLHPEPVDHGWAHFDGPLSMEFVDGNMKLPAAGGPSVHLRVAVVTPSVPCGTDANQKEVSSNPTTTTPGLLTPTVTIKFPSEQEEFISQRYDLDQFC